MLNQNESDTRSLVIERELPHPPENVWRALTQSALIDKWLMKNDFQPIAGHKFNFRAAPMPHWDGVVHCEVLDVKPREHLSYSWRSAGLLTIVKWTLMPTKHGTHLRMQQSGFPPQDEASYSGADYGWQKFLANLERVLAGLG